MPQARPPLQATVGLAAPPRAAIIGLEPSSLLTLRDEYLYRAQRPGGAQVLAAQAVTLRSSSPSKPRPARCRSPSASAPCHILLHGHCHQKALVGTGPGRQALSLPPNYVTEVDSGCCGMAGSFWLRGRA